MYVDYTERIQRDKVALQGDPHGYTLLYLAVFFLFVLAVRWVLSDDRLHMLVTPHVKVD